MSLYECRVARVWNDMSPSVVIYAREDVSEGECLAVSPYMKRGAGRS